MIAEEALNPFAEHNSIFFLLKTQQDKKLEVDTCVAL